MAGRIGSRLAGLALSASVALALALPLRAQTILRDAELERSLRELARPVITAAGLSPARIRILVIEDSRLNAFVLNAQTIMIHSGMLLKATKPEMLQGVIAHEVAHIANGHLTRRPVNAANARNAALIGLALSAAAASQDARAAAGLAIGSASAAQRVYLGHTRAEEASADQSGARYMASAGIDPGGMVEVLEIFSGQEALSRGRQDPYVLSHPLSRDRLRAARGYAAAYGKRVEGTDAASAYWFARAHAKLSAYLRHPDWTLRRIAKGDTSDPALVAKAVAYHQARKLRPALAAVDQLIAKRPDDANAHELKGWILLESRQVDASVSAYSRAVALAPSQPLILADYGRALLAQNTAASNAKALSVLRKSKSVDPLNPTMLRNLGLAYARAGDNGMASVVTAERYAVAGRLQDAEVHAKRAMGLLPRGSTGWRRAQDILVAAEAQEKRTSR